MKLRFFKDAEKANAENILSKAITYLLPNPEEKLADPEILKFINKVSQEIGIDEVKNKEAEAEIIEAISNELSTLILMGSSEDSLKSRLGDKGISHSNQYKITFDEPFEPFEELGVRRSHVEGVVRSPDTYELLLPERFGGRVRLALYAKNFNGKGQEDPFVVVVIAQVKEQTLLVSAAHRIYLADIDVSKVEKPTDLLREFANRFGLYFRIGNREQKYIHYDAIPVETILAQNKDLSYDSSSNIIQGHMFAFENPHNADFLFISYVQVNEDLNVLEIALAYALNENAYKKSLRSHGVHL